MNDNNFEQDLGSIRAMMERSSKFISLTGLSGIIIGCYALVGSAVSFYILKDADSPAFFTGLPSLMQKTDQLLLVAAAVFVAAIITVILLTLKKAKERGQSVWGKASRRLAFNLYVPILTGIIFMLIVLYQDSGNVIYVMPASMIFYGLALINASNFTFGDVKYLGLSEIGMGLIAATMPAYGLLYWAAGFGVLHIVYGTVMYLKYDRENTLR